MDFWNDEVTERSWVELVALNKEIDFTLIGGWATYLYTKLQKSKDIDIIVDYPELRKLSAGHAVAKDDRLRRYEVKLEGFDVDIYLPGYSELELPAQDITGRLLGSREGFRVPRQEVLLLLKLGAYASRAKSIKGGKDAIDLLGLLFYSELNFKLLGELVAKYNKKERMGLLLEALNGFDRKQLGFLNLNEKGFAEMRKGFSGEIRRLL